MATALLIYVSCNSFPLSSLKGDNCPCNACPSKASFGCRSTSKLRCFQCKALQDTKEKGSTSSSEEITEKFGLEAGLWKIFSSKEEGQEESKQKSKTDQAKELLAKYGGAYLVTSISLSIVSFSLCYLLISAGVDVADLLQKVGITANEAGEGRNVCPSIRSTQGCISNQVSSHSSPHSLSGQLDRRKERVETRCVICW